MAKQTFIKDKQSYLRKILKTLLILNFYNCPGYAYNNTNARVWTFKLFILQILYIYCPEIMVHYYKLQIRLSLQSNIICFVYKCIIIRIYNHIVLITLSIMRRAYTSAIMYISK